MTRLILGALALLLTVPAQAQRIEDLDPSPLSTEAETPRSEGIQVHGRWTVTVREADGRVVEERVFQNALTPTGAFVLTLTLLGGFSDPAPRRVNRVRVGATSEAGMPCTSEGAGVPCYVVESSHATAGQSNVFANLVLAPIGGQEFSLENYAGFVMQGSFQASRDAAINQVATVYDTFGDGTVGSFGTTEEFTLKTLDAPVPVAAGQTVDVRVEITFE